MLGGGRSVSKRRVSGEGSEDSTRESEAVTWSGGTGLACHARGQCCYCCCCTTAKEAPVSNKIAAAGRQLFQADAAARPRWTGEARLELVSRQSIDILICSEIAQRLQTPLVLVRRHRPRLQFNPSCQAEFRDEQRGEEEKGERERESALGRRG